MLNVWIIVYSVACLSFIDGKTEEIRHDKVIIIGAGIAGYGAACRLLENNITDFSILEGEDRIGGRIKSIYVGENFVDIGAEYIHGEDGNLVYELSKHHIPLPQKGELFNLYYSNGDKVQESLVIDFFQLLFQLEKYPGAPNVSLSETVLMRYKEKVLPKYENDKKTQHIAEEFIKTIEIIFLTIEGSFDWHSLRSKFHNFKVYHGHPLLSWYGKGYKTIFDILKTNIGEDNAALLEARINLKKTVKRIETKEKLIHVECTDGSKYTANHVIFTPSLGVLKHDYKEFFHPALEEEKVKAMNALDIGGIMKIALEFPKNWWINATDTYLIWSDEDEKILSQDFPFGPTKDGKHWLSYVHCISPAPNNSEVAIAWIGGHLVPEVEKMDDKKLKEGIMYVIKKFLGKTHEITEPISMVYSKWCSDPHFRGSFSYEPIDVYKLTTSPHEDLLKPVLDNAGVPRLLFAGEATHPRRFSTADGALGTGYMQADKLIQYWKEQYDRK